jgi:hypothetical protein
VRSGTSCAAFDEAEAERVPAFLETFSSGRWRTTIRMTPKFRTDLREKAELTSDGGYRLDVTPAEGPRLRRRLALQPDPGSRCISTRSSFRVVRESSGVLWVGTSPVRKRTAVQQRRTAGACPRTAINAQTAVAYSNPRS